MAKRKHLFFLKSLSLRYAVTVAVIILVCFAALIGIINTAVGRYFYSMQGAEAERLADSCSSILRVDYQMALKQGVPKDEIITVKNEAFCRRLATLSGDSNLFVLITNPEGELLCFDDTAPFVGDDDILPSITQAVTEQGVYRGISDCGIFSDDYFVHANKVEDHRGEFIAIVCACSPLALAQQPVTEVMQTIIIICILVMVVTVVSVYFVTWRLMSPIEALSHAAQAVSVGDYTVRVPVHGNNEITELAVIFNEMADNLEKLERTRNDFVANVSHDLRSPMTSINGFVDGMLSGVIPPEKHKHYLKVVLNETQRLSRLVGTLLDISRIQAGVRKFSMQPLDICEMARQIVLSFENRLEEKNLQVSFEAARDHIFVKADMDAIHQVMYNLCDNAIKFSSDEAHFTVRIEEADSLATVYVYNEGQGIAPEDMEHIFDRFYKGDKSRGMDKCGTGLGLFIAKTIIDEHRQKIGVRSVCGQFCEFYFTLERAETPEKYRIAE